MFKKRHTPSEEHRKMITAFQKQKQQLAEAKAQRESTFKYDPQRSVNILKQVFCYKEGKKPIFKDR